MHNYGHWKKTLALLVMSALSLGASSVDAMPEGGVVRSGSGSVTQNGKEMTIRQDSGRLAMDWTGFSVGKDETVRFQQPGKDALALNRVTGNQQSVIDGSLLSNGHVLLVNPNGVVIGKNASIDVGGLVASTAQVKDNFMKEFGNSTGAFSLGGVSDGKIINEGTIKAEGGLVALHAAKVENSGTISNTGGSAVLAAADTLTLTPDADGKLNFTVDGKAAEASALNKGAITADGGTIVMTADSASDVMSTVVNNSGTLQARTLRKNEKGQILLEGGDKGQVEVSGTLDASGTEEGQSAGNIKVIGEKTIVHDGTNLLARGNVDGGKIETSGDVLNLGDNLNIDASGNRGSHGTWLLDPLEVVISATKPSSADHNYGTIVGDTNGKTKNNVIYNDPPSGQNANNSYNSTTWIDSNQVGNILSNGTDVMIQAISSSGAASITLESPIDITVSSSASKNPTFTLEANRNITINQNITAKSGGKGLNIMLNADTDGDNIGAVIMNADVTTNGGWFKSATGGNVTHTYGTSDADKKNYGTYNGVKIDGGPKHDGSTVGTYFGGKDTAKQAENRFIKTNGGAITLNGEVAIGLNGGTLTLDTGGGNLTVTGLINSGNSYKAYIYGSDDWKDNKMIQKMVEQYLKDGTVPAYHYIGITYDRDKDGNLIKDGNGYKWSTKKGIYADGANSIHYVLNALTDTTTASRKSGTELSAINPQWYTSIKAGEGYDSFIVDKASTITVDEYLAYVKKSAPGNWKTKYYALTFDEIKKDTTKMETLKADIAELIAHNWFLAEQIAENGRSGGAKVGDSYLATITTRLENSLSTPNGQHTLWVGGRGSGVRGRTVKDDPNNPATWGPSDPTLMDGFYWVTGPEGAASTYKDSEGNTLKYDAGTKFWDTVSSDWKTGKNGEKAYGLDPTWSTYKSGRKIITQPDNNGPFLTVGFGSDNQWDDANFGGETTWGFVQETNLANSSLKINTGKGSVALKGDIGKGQALDTLSIDGGTVKIGDTSNKVTDYNHGTVYVDHGLKITGTGNATVGGEIHSGENPETDTSTTLEDTYKDNVTILSSGDIEVHGITSNTYGDGTTTTRGGKISLTSTGDKGKITLGAGVDYDGNATDGTLAAASAEQGAVVIDAQGTKGAFVNETTGDKGIDTAGTWLIYSASPDKDTFKTNLNSETDAEWTAKSDDNANTDNSSGKTMHVYDTKDSTHTTNKYIFQVQPVITVSGTDTTKTYGVEWGTNDLKNLISYSASYVNIDNDSIDVSTGKDQKGNAFTNAFKELDYKNYISNADGTEVGESNISYSSKGAARTADRVTGDKEDANHNKILAKSDNQPAVYNLLVEKKSGTKGLHGYDVTTNDGSIEITKRQVTINQNGTITYGSSQGIAYEAPTSEEATDITGLTNRDTIGSVTMTASKEYQNSKGTRNTGDTGTYDLTTDGTNTHIVNNGKDVSVNYDISGSGKLTVEKATLTLDTGSTTKEYGDAAGVKYFLTDKEKNYTLDGFVNGDENDTDKQKAIRGQIGVTNKSEALKDDSHTSDVLNGGNSGYTIDTVATPNADLKNYNVVVKNGNTVTLKPVDIYIYAEGNGSTLGDVTWTKITRDDLVNGDSWDKGLFAFRVEPGDLISYADKTFGIKGYVNGQPISDGTQIGNYIYHPTGIVRLTFNPIVKPDVWAHSGGYRPRNKIETSLPVFRVEDAKVGQYGTYGVEHNEEGDKLVLSATGMRLPEPDQVPDEERTFTTTLSTETGSGTFKLVYNGVSLKVYPQDKEAEETVRAGDKTKNVSLSEKALYVGYTEMGLDLIDLKGVYIYFN